MKKISIKLNYDQLEIFVVCIELAINEQHYFTNSQLCILSVISELYFKLAKENFFKRERKTLKISLAEGFAIMHLWESGMIYSYNEYSNMVLNIITGSIDQQTKSLIQ